ncbi:MAG: carbamoyl phosphate synthase small subunit [Clostridia bacterium]|nr:carbamoyl phosphate synthase small subunit [Clostridia bacterium]
MKAELILENGMRFAGELFGDEREVVGEVIFSTNMAVGYQEAITNPAAAGQIVVTTFPLIGNYGANTIDMESDKAAMTALVVREKCDFPSNFRCEKTLDSFMKEKGVVGLCGIDTRALTRVIRDNGTMKGVIALTDMSDGDAEAKMAGFDESKLVMSVTTKEKYTYTDKGDRNVAVIDLGVKKSTLEELAKRNAKVTVFPADASSEEIMAIKPDVVFLSGGPGNPADALALEAVKALLGKVKVCGIALGHMVIALALGCKVEKLSFGHHGGNYPVKDIASGRVLITAQNDNYVITGLADGVSETFKNVNDGTIAGFECKDKNAEGVLFTPNGGESVFQDGFVFDRFLGKED